jgi:hypothetical protein
MSHAISWHLPLTSTPLRSRGPYVAAMVGLAVFLYGDKLFGSSSGTIDSYNRHTLETCEVPEGSTLVRTYVAPLVDKRGGRFRSMSYVFASPWAADELAAFYGVDGPGIETLVPSTLACRFTQRPAILVLELWEPSRGDPLDQSTQTAAPTAATRDTFWGGDGSTRIATLDTPPGTRSFLRLRLAQREVKGVF